MMLGHVGSDSFKLATRPAAAKRYNCPNASAWPNESGQAEALGRRKQAAVQPCSRGGDAEAESQESILNFPSAP